MTADALILVLGLVLLWRGADAVVNGAVAVARRFNVSEIAIGLTLVSMGTSLPELVVNVVASFRGSAELAIANVLGSNVANILLILGVAAFVCALPIRDTTLYSEIPFSMTSALLVGFLANAHILSQEPTRPLRSLHLPRLGRRAGDGSGGSATRLAAEAAGELRVGQCRTGARRSLGRLRGRQHRGCIRRE